MVMKRLFAALNLSLMSVMFCIHAPPQFSHSPHSPCATPVLPFYILHAPPQFSHSPHSPCATLVLSFSMRHISSLTLRPCIIVVRCVEPLNNASYLLLYSSQRLFLSTLSASLVFARCTYFFQRLFHQSYSPDALLALHFHSACHPTTSSLSSNVHSTVVFFTRPTSFLSSTVVLFTDPPFFQLSLYGGLLHRPTSFPSSNANSVHSLASNHLYFALTVVTELYVAPLLHNLVPLVR
jgi:hypothetical protein